jgi:hypothetical protein
LGIRGGIARRPLADANERRDWRIYQDFALSLIQTARQLYAQDDLGVALTKTVDALDATTIDRCLARFPWARFRQTKGAVKLHTLLDRRGSIPRCSHIADGQRHDVNLLDRIAFAAGSFSIMDRGYIDFTRLHRRHQAQAFFVVRAQSNLPFRRVAARPVAQEIGWRCDQTIPLTTPNSRHGYPDPLRRVKYDEAGNDPRWVCLTHPFDRPALTLAERYRARWPVAWLFQWIKPHRSSKAFFGTAENAVNTQVWIAIAVYGLVAIVKKRLGSDASLYTILPMLSLTLFENTPIDQLLNHADNKSPEAPALNQLDLFT